MALIYHQDPFTISFDEVGNAFESFYSYYPEMMGEVNTTDVAPGNSNGDEDAGDRHCSQSHHRTGRRHQRFRGG